MEVASSSERFLKTYQDTRRHISEYTLRQRQEFPLVDVLPLYPMLKMEVTGSVEIVVTNYQTIRPHIPEDSLRRETAGSSKTLVSYDQVIQPHISEHCNFCSLPCSTERIQTTPSHYDSLRLVSMLFFYVQIFYVICDVLPLA
jgi:hypothetical protein